MTNSWIRVASVLLALVLLMVAVTPAAASGGAGFAQPARHYIVWQKLCHDSVKVAPDGKGGSIAACIQEGVPNVIIWIEKCPSPAKVKFGPYVYPSNGAITELVTCLVEQ